jgi:4-amino-4-deoxy-L-arabinose transferase-like glycosyltransferase
MSSPKNDAPEWRLPLNIAGLLMLAWWLALGLYYYHQPHYAPIWGLLPHMLPNLFQMRAGTIWSDLKVLAALSWLLLLGYGLGRTLLRKTRLEAKDFMGNAVLSLGLGWGVMSLCMLAAGLVHLWRVDVVMTVLTAASVALGVEFWRRPSLDEKTSPIGKRETRGEQLGFSETAWKRILVGILVVFAAFNLFAAFMPEIFYDALVYHLALPELYWLHGGIVATPENIYSGLPMLVNMLYALALPLGGDALAHLIHWSFGIGTAAVVYVFCRDISDETTGLEAALLFYTVPLVGVLSWKAGADLGWAFFQMLSVYALAQRLDRVQAGEGRRWTLLAGIFAGLAMGTKYQAWPLAGLMACSFFFLVPAGLEIKEKAKEACLFLGAALAVLLPWLLKDYVLYGNPIYPFFHEYLARGPVPSWRGLLADGGKKDLTVLLTTWAGIKSLALLPWSVTFQNNDLNSIGPIFLFGIPIFFLCRFHSARTRFLASVFLGLTAVWALSSSLSRFFLPHLPLACILFAVALRDMRKLKAAIRPAFLFFFAVNFFWVGSWPYSYEASAALLGNQSKSEYLSAPHPGYARPPYAAIRYVNENLPKDARALFIGEGRSFYCERDRVAMTRFNPEPLLGWIRGSKDGRDLADRLRRERITTVLLNVNELLLWRQGADKFLPLSEREEAVFSDFESHFLRQVAEFKGEPKADFSWSWVTVSQITNGS